MPTDPLSLTFAGSFVVGLFFLLITAFTGHDTGHHDGGLHHHSDGHDHGGNSFSLFAIFNPLSIALFLIGSGFFGYVFHATTSLALPIIFMMAGSGGLVVAIPIILILRRLFGGPSSTTVQDVSDRTGLLGKVSVTIPQDSIGEIIYVSPGGMRKSIPARTVNGQRLERNVEVVVVNYQRGVAEVDTWEQFANQDESSSTLAISEADELATLRALLEENDKDSSQYILKKETQKE